MAFSESSEPKAPPAPLPSDPAAARLAAVPEPHLPDALRPFYRVTMTGLRLKTPKIQLQRASSHLPLGPERVAQAVTLMRSSSGREAPSWLAPVVRRVLGPRVALRVHTGARADQAMALLGARAATFGADIFFAAGEFRPRTPRGDELLAHELMHVAQQHGTIPHIDAFSDPSEREARDAERFAARAASRETRGADGRPAPVTARIGSGLAVARAATAGRPLVEPAGGDGEGAVGRITGVVPHQDAGDHDAREEPSVDEFASQIYGIIRSRLAVEMERRAWH